MIKTDIKRVSAIAPASCANIAVGYDILGFALESPNDEVTLICRDDHQLIIEPSMAGKHPLPIDIDKNTATVALKNMMAALHIKCGFTIRINKGIPISSGMGSSAACAVAAVLALNHFLIEPVSRQQLAQYAMMGEAVASGNQHPDNITPCLYGGLTLCYQLDPIKVIQLPVPDCYYVLVHPDLRLDTKLSRAQLDKNLPLVEYVKQSANLSAFIAALYQRDLSMIKSVLKDELVEPRRAASIQGFYRVKQAALSAGAMGVSISGSGPSVFAFAQNQLDAQQIAAAMVAAFQQENIKSESWIATVGQKGAYIKQVEHKS